MFPGVSEEPLKEWKNGADRLHPLKSHDSRTVERPVLMDLGAVETHLHLLQFSL